NPPPPRCAMAGVARAIAAPSTVAERQPKSLLFMILSLQKRPGRWASQGPTAESAAGSGHLAISGGLGIPFIKVTDIKCVKITKREGDDPNDALKSTVSYSTYQGGCSS